MVEKKDIICMDCKSSGSSIFVDEINGEVVCKNCGMVQKLTIWKNDVYDQ